MKLLGAIGVALHGFLLVGLTAVCAFDDRQLAPDASDCLIPVAMVLLPFIFGVRVSRGGQPVP
jgi:hypothetical protein